MKLEQCLAYRGSIIIKKDVGETNEPLHLPTIGPFPLTESEMQTLPTVATSCSWENHPTWLINLRLNNKG